MTAATTPATPPRPRAGIVTRLARWEVVLVIAILGLIALGTNLSPFFLSADNFGNLIAALMEVAIMALPMTLGTLALFRGMALIVLGPRGVSNFPAAFTDFGFGHVPGTPIPWPFVVFAILAAILAVVLHRTWIGRQIYAIGKNGSASRYAGVRVTRVKIGLFMLSGLVASLAGIILTSRLSSSRADAAEGMTLTVVTVVLLGGVNIFGGSGTIPGVVLAVLAVAVMQNALRLANVTVEVQSVALGSLLILSVVLPSFAHQVKSAVDRVRAGRAPPDSLDRALVR